MSCLNHSGSVAEIAEKCNLIGNECQAPCFPAKEMLKDVKVISALRRETLQESCDTTRREGNDLEQSSQTQNNH